MSKQLKGSLMVITAGIAWGVSGVSGQYLMAHGVNVNLLTSLRLILAGTLLTASVFFRQRDKLVQAIKDKKTLVTIALFAVFGLVLNQYAYLSAIQHTNAGTATVLRTADFQRFQSLWRLSWLLWEPLSSPHMVS